MIWIKRFRIITRMIIILHYVIYYKINYEIVLFIKYLNELLNYVMNIYNTEYIWRMHTQEKISWRIIKVDPQVILYRN